VVRPVLTVRVVRRAALVAVACATVLAPASAASKVGRGLEVEKLTVARVQQALRDRRTTCRQIVARSLQRVAAYDDHGPRLNALITVNPRAISQAAHAPRGPLHCVPILLKDNYDTADLPTTGSSAALKDSRPPDDAETVRRLRAAGAVVIGKANLTELALTGVTFGSLGGQTRNPYDLTRTPGVSSGGTGAGVASGFAVAGTGSDTVNSIRSPSSANSLVGIRPTAGLVSRDGIIPLSSTQDAAGPLARTVRDAASLLDVMAGYDADDPITARAAGHRPRGGYAGGLNRRALRGARIGLLLPFQPDPSKPLDRPVARIMRRVVHELRAAGARVVPLPFPGVTPDGLISGLDVQRWEIRPQLDHYLGSFPAPVSSLQALLDSGLVAPQFVGVLERAQAADSDDPEYARRRLAIPELSNRVLQLMAQHRVGALAYPQQRRLVVPIGEDQSERNGILAALTGLPTIDVPAGFSAPTRTAPRGVPVGLELTGRPFAEPRLLDLAYAYEQATHHRRAPASTP